MSKETHFQAARRIIKAWPKWKQKIGLHPCTRNAQCVEVEKKEAGE